MRARIGVALTTAGCALALAACGGSGTSGPVAVGTNPNAANSPLHLSECMRAHGLPSFPDPTQGPGGPGFNGLGFTFTGDLIVDGITFSGPALKGAEAACKSILPPTGPPPKLSAAQYRTELAFSTCMRKHGVPNFPDPTARGTPRS